MVGDTEADILAGKSAGTKTIGVSYGFHGAKIAESYPDFVVEDITAIISIILAGSAPLTYLPSLYHEGSYY